MTDVNSLKDQGNKAFAAKDYDKAIELFSEAIKLDPSNHVLYSNRSAAKAGKRLWDAALEDAESCIKVNPTWSKGFARKGAALHGLHNFDGAIAAYEEGIKLEDSPALRKGLKEVQDAKSHESSSSSGGATGLGKIFADPNMIGKLAGNPKTQKYLSDPGFMNTLLAIQKNPELAQGAFQDPRMIEVMGVLMGIDMQAFSRPEGSGDDFPPQAKSQASPSFSSSSSRPSPSSYTPRPSSSKVQEDVPMAEPEEEEDPDVIEEKKAKAGAEEQKKIGSEAYRKRDFETAAAAFEKAWDLWPKDVTFLTNLSAVQFEQDEYDKCIATCEKAVDEGRSVRADYKLIAKAYGRIGSAYQRKGDLDVAVKFFNKSLTEHRTPDILNKLRDTEREKAAADAAAYLDPALSEKAREEGNAMFKAGDFVGAVSSYTESIKRDPKDPRGYNNRALCYTKLAALPEALKDAEKAIEIDPKFVKAYIRKSAVLFAMREYTKAVEAIQVAAERDEDGSHTKEIQQQLIKCNQALSAQRAGESEQQTLERAMRDPEIGKIMNDPVMQQILQQAQQDPGALQDHMKNPIVRDKIMKLINAGVIKTR
ncbi:chaperone [Phellopilus nigrolimitatus]|nr:chaperone [Phellopilus nigrolimitatus]